MRLRAVAMLLAGLMALPAAAQDVTQAVVIAGYRSAHFGAGEAEVRAAIKKDLGVDDAVAQANPVERTTVLMVPDRTLLPDAPPATVAYIFGATTGKLAQVNIIWGENGGSDVGKIVTAANSLIAYFLEKGSYATGSVVVNQPLPDGTTLGFRGADANGRMIILQLIPALEPNLAADAKGPPVQVKKALLKLSYIESPGKPDILRIEKGQF